MSNIIAKLRQDQAAEEASPKGCKMAMEEHGGAYPCAHDCPCALRALALTQADRIEALEAENAQMREALSGLIDALDAVDREAERADQPGATAWSSAPVVALRYKRQEARAILGGSK